MSASRQIIGSPRFSDIIEGLKARGVQDLHMTNSSFLKERVYVQSTTHAGFQYIRDQSLLLPDHAIVIATNTDKGLCRVGKNPGHRNFRLMKAFAPVADHFPAHTVIGIYHDEDTPQEMYDALAENFNIRTLHKHGDYGLGAEVVAGANCAERAFTFVGGEKPANPGHAPVGDQGDKVEIVNLYECIGPHGKPYLNAQHELLF